jgi:hypothetical protein
VVLMFVNRRTENTIIYINTSEDRWSNECAWCVKQAIWAGVSIERALEIFRECWVLELRDEAKRVEAMKL